MRKEYDFTKAKPNPYARQVQRHVTVVVDGATADYFDRLAKDLGLPSKDLINLYLKDCVLNRRRPNVQWKKVAATTPRRRRATTGKTR